jgi:hypothetical protein
VGLLAHDHRSDWRRALEPRGGVDDIAGDHRLSEAGARIERHDRFAGIDRDANVQPVLSLGPFADSKCGSNRPLRIVAVRDGRAEHAHDRIADELLDQASVVLDFGPNPLVVRIE